MSSQRKGGGKGKGGAKGGAGSGAAPAGSAANVRPAGGKPGRSTPLVQRLTELVDADRLPYRLVLGGAGLLVSAYLTILHFTAGQGLYCPEGGVVNCAAVLSSPESSVLGIPVAAFGLVFFAVYLASVFARRRLSSPRQSQFALAWALGGAVVVMYLVFAELFLVHYICLWCSFTHLLVLALFILEMWPTSATDDVRADARRHARLSQARPAAARAGRR